MSEAIHAGRFTKGSFTYDHIVSFPVNVYIRWHHMMVKAIKDAGDAQNSKKGGDDGE